MNRAGLWAVILLASLAAFLSFHARIADGGTPGWDSASHGLQGYALAQDISRFDVVNLVADAFGHRYRYPPGHPMLLAGAFLVYGPSWWTAIGISAILFALLAVVLYVTAESKVAGWIAALLALTCPALLALSGMIMLDLPAAILMALSLRLYARSLEDDRAVRPLGWTLTVFMLTAAQYAACAIAMLMAFEAWRSRSWLKDVLGRFFKSRALHHPIHILIALALLTAIAIRLTGGWKIGSLSMTRAGGPMIAAALLAGIRVAWLCWKRRAEVQALPKRYRDIFMTAVVPIYAWVFVIYPPRFQQFAEWISRPGEVHARTDLAFWSFYPEYFLRKGHVTLWVTLGVVALVIGSLVRRSQPERIRFMQWAVVAGAVLVLGHHARQVRFIVPFLVAWWMLASDTLASCFSTSRMRLLAGMAAAGAIVAPAFGLYAENMLGAVSPPPIHRDYVDVLRWTMARIGDAPSYRVIGGIDGLSRHLFEWELRKRFDLRTRRLEFNLDLPEHYATDPQGPRKVYDAWLAGDPEHVVVAIEPIDLNQRFTPWEGVRKSDHAWPEFTMRFLSGEKRYRRVEGENFIFAKVRIMIYRRMP